ncbi:hypothetical protein L3081_25005 [Colwellia sp. MSW7]|uniref:Uncharacterized protein n=1 Tax=Colwellia maritima TaxID=2912588 RepID=A0ABS9X773_9GAMM|nr:hypothetical protein [Colwellia maritima]MCI2286085.1 hypothetical protein [Colwellia maritima]
MVDKHRELPCTKNLIECIDEIEDMAFCGEEVEPDEYKAWLLTELKGQVNVNHRTNQLHCILKEPYTFDECPTNNVGMQIRALREACKTHLNGHIPFSLELDEDNISNLAFVLKNSVEESVLDSISQKQFEHFCNAGEDCEAYSIDVSCDDWLDHLQEMILALTITFVAITAISDSLRESDSLRDNENV